MVRSFDRRDILSPTGLPGTPEPTVSGARSGSVVAALVVRSARL
jgi:hypothetical protein